MMLDWYFFVTQKLVSRKAGLNNFEDVLLPYFAYLNTIMALITICILLLLSYVFDITAAKTKIPSVILLLILGFVANIYVYNYFNSSDAQVKLDILAES